MGQGLPALVLLFLLAPAAASGEEPLSVRVVARRYAWRFEYSDKQSSDELRLPAGRPVVLILRSLDTAHRFAVPDLALKEDVEPSADRRLRLPPLAPGRHPIVCLRYCGSGHKDMISTLRVLPREEFQEWLATAPAREEAPTVERGRALFSRLGCGLCHAVDAKGPSTGPRLHGIYGSRRLLTGGARVLADEAYLRESILRPAAQVSAGYQALMPPFSRIIPAKQLDALVLYLKSVR